MEGPHRKPCLGNPVPEAPPRKQCDNDPPRSDKDAVVGALFSRSNRLSAVSTAKDKCLALAQIFFHLGKNTVV